MNSSLMSSGNCSSGDQNALTWQPMRCNWAISSIGRRDAVAETALMIMTPLGELASLKELTSMMIAAAVHAQKQDNVSHG